MTLSRIPTNTKYKRGIDPGKKKILFVLGFIFIIIVLYGLYSLKKVVPDNKQKIPIKVSSGDQPIPKKLNIVVNTGGFPLNMRKDHDEKSDKVGQIPDKTKLEVREELDGWYKVSYNNKEGWISKKYTMLADAPKPAGSGDNLQAFKGNGFIFKYPKDWNAQNYTSPDGSLRIAISNNQLPANAPTGSYFIPIDIKVYSGAQKPSGGFRTDPSSKKEATTVGGAGAVKFTYTNSDSTEVNTIEVVRGDSVYDFNDNGGYLDDLNKILSTFSFQ